MHVDETLRTGALVQVVDILRAQKKALAEFRLELKKCDVGGVGLCCSSLRAPLRVELSYEGGVGLQSFGSANLFNVVAGPQPIRRSEGRQAALGRDAGARQDENAVSR
jgi:hypothetical protein